MSRNGRRILTRATIATWIVLVGSGVYQVLFYRPTAVAAYSDVETLASPTTAGRFMRDIHRLGGFAAVALLLAWIVVYLIDRRQQRTAFGIVAWCVATAGIFTGYLLPWDQLALWAVTVGSNMNGFAPLFNDSNVRFVLIDGTEISVDELRFWFVVHVAVIPAVIGAIWWLANRQRRA